MVSVSRRGAVTSKHSETFPAIDPSGVSQVPGGGAALGHHRRQLTWCPQDQEHVREGHGGGRCQAFAASTGKLAPEERSCWFRIIVKKWGRGSGKEKFPEFDTLFSTWPSRHPGKEGAQCPSCIWKNHHGRPRGAFPGNVAPGTQLSGSWTHLSSPAVFYGSSILFY